MMLLLLSSCKTVQTVYITKTVVPKYTFPKQPDLPKDVAPLPDSTYKIPSSYLKAVLTYFTQIDGLEAQIEADRKLYGKQQLYIPEENR